MIYLFTNDLFGKFFIETARQYTLKSNQRIIVIYSGTRSTSISNLKTAANFVLKSLANLFKKFSFKKNTGLQLKWVENINSPSFCKKIKKDDHGIVAGFNQIFEKETICRFRGLVNFHPSVLPLYRGPVPSYWCLHHGESKTGFTLHKITDQIDKGEILYQDAIFLGKTKDPLELDEEIAKIAQPIFWKYLEHVCKSETEWKNQVLDAQSIYKKKIDYLSFPQKNKKL